MKNIEVQLIVTHGDFRHPGDDMILLPADAGVRVNERAVSQASRLPITETLRMGRTQRMQEITEF